MMVGISHHILSPMTYVVDSKRRATMPAGIKPGAAVVYRPDGDGSWRLTVLRPAEAPFAQVRRVKGRLLIVGTQPVDVAGSLREMRDER